MIAYNYQPRTLEAMSICQESVVSRHAYQSVAAYQTCWLRSTLVLTNYMIDKLGLTNRSVRMPVGICKPA
jgi:hypothetical protein